MSGHDGSFGKIYLKPVNFRMELSVYTNKPIAKMPIPIVINDKAHKLLFFKKPFELIEKNKSTKPIIKIKPPTRTMIDDKRGENNLASIDIQMLP
jgi:hypothetical protein